VLLKLFAEGIPALPIHDCVCVPHSKTERARVIMLEVFEVYTGIQGVVKVEMSHRVVQQPIAV